MPTAEFDLPPRLTPETPLSEFDLPTRLRTVLTRRIPVADAGELAALPAEMMGHISGLGRRTRPVLTELVRITRIRLGRQRFAARLAGDTPVEDRPLADLAAGMTRWERTALSVIGVRTLGALAAMPRAVLARIDGIGPDALGRLTALCLHDRDLSTLSGLRAALMPERRDAVELVYGLRDGQVRSVREVATILCRRPSHVERLVEPDRLADLPPMRVLAAAVREAIEPVGFAVLPVVAGRIARRLPAGADDKVDPRAFARLGALLIRPGSDAAEAAEVTVVAAPRWTPALLDALADVLRTAHRLRLDERSMAARLVSAAQAAGVDDVDGDALLLAVAGLVPEIVLTLSPPEPSPPAITDPEVLAIVGAPPEAACAVPLAEPSPHLDRPPPPDSAEGVREAVIAAARLGETEADPLPGAPMATVRAALEAGGVRALAVPRGPQVVPGLAAGLAAGLGADAVRVVAVGRALTAGLGAMVDAARLDPAERSARLADALDEAIDLGGAARPGVVTVLAELTLALTLGMQDWLARLLARAADGHGGLLLVAAPGRADADGLLIDRLHRLPGVGADRVIGLESG